VEVRAVDTVWIVVLEAGDDSGRTSIDIVSLRRLLYELTDSQPAALYDPQRYALQIRLTGLHPVEALAMAVDRWRTAVTRLGLPDWPLCRAEVLTQTEFDRDQSAEPAAIATTDGRRVARPVPPTEGGADLLLRDAFHDSLTGLANRELFRERVRLALHDPVAPESAPTVLILDLDGFARVNERLGHVRGDQVLAMVAARLLSSIGPRAVVARLGGDEFAVLIDESSNGRAVATAELALGAVRDQHAIDGHRLSLTASAGLASAAAGGDPDRLLREAGAAMCTAKEAGGNRLLRFDPTMRTDHSRLEPSGDPIIDRLAYVLLLQRAAMTANTCHDLAEAALVVLEEVCAHTGWPIGRLYVPGADGDNAEPTGAFVVTGLDRYRAFAEAVTGRAQLRGRGVAGEVLATGAPAWHVDLVSLFDGDGTLAALAAAASIRSAIGFPVLIGDRVAGVLEFFSPWARPPEGSLLELMAGVGTQLGRVIERTSAEEALRRSEQRYRALAESAGDAVVSVDDRGVVVYWNAAARLTFGYSDAEVLGHRFAILSPEHLHARNKGALEDLMARAEASGFMELTCRRRDGSDFPAEVFVSSWEEEGRRYFTGVIREVTRQIEDDLRAS